MTLKHPTGGFLYSGLPVVPTFRTECHSHSISNSRQATVKAALVSAQSANDEQKRRADWAIQNCEARVGRVGRVGHRGWGEMQDGEMGGWGGDGGGWGGMGGDGGDGGGWGGMGGMGGDGGGWGGMGGDGGMRGWGDGGESCCFQNQNLRLSLRFSGWQEFQGIGSGSSRTFAWNLSHLIHRADDLAQLQAAQVGRAKCRTRGKNIAATLAWWRMMLNQVLVLGLVSRIHEQDDVRVSHARLV